MPHDDDQAPAMQVVYNDRMGFKDHPRGWHGGFCHVRLYVGVGRIPVAIVTELGENHGWSVTNGAEAVHRTMWEYGNAHLGQLFRDGFIHIEHYPWRFRSEQLAEWTLVGRPGGSSARRPDVFERCTWSLVEFTLGEGTRVSHARWLHLGLAEIERLIGGRLEEQSAHGMPPLPLVEIGEKPVPWRAEWPRELIAPEAPRKAGE